MFSSNTTQTSGGYQISRSLRFNSADSAYLNRSLSTATSAAKFTLSFWLKRSTLSSYQDFLSQSGSAVIFFNNTDQLSVVNASGSAYTSAVFRDLSAWYHIVFVFDSTNATSGDRIIIYVNGVRQATSSYTAPALNATGGLNTASAHYIGSYVASSEFLNGYMTEVNFIDGQALTPSSFGETNAQTGVWGPKAYSGTYGTNGFYVNFSDNSNTTAATLGKDSSGNGNNWTPNNFSVTAGAGNDSLVDSPTRYGTDTGVGGEVRGNYCTLNPLDNGGLTIANGNLQFDRATASWISARATMGMTSGKWYWEVTPTATSGTLYCQVGIALNLATVSSFFTDAYGWGYSAHSGSKDNNNTQTAYGATWTTNDVIGIAFDADAGTLTFYKNNTSQGTAFTGLTSGPYIPAVSMYGTQTAVINFGQRPFAYTAPSGYKALCTQNLPTPTIGATTATQAGKYFNSVLWTANGGVQNITGAGLQPDLLWIKDRQNANSNTLHNIVVGPTKYLSSNTYGAEYTSANEVTSIDSDGWSMGTVNYGSGRPLVSWCWKANGSGSTNTAGSITSTVSANTTSGFSIVTFTVPASGTATVGHGLGVAPSLMFVKTRSTDFQWDVYHASLGNSAYVVLSTTSAQVTGATTVWNATSPTSTVFSLGTAWSGSLPSATCVAYCFAEVAGYSKIGSYTGNGSTDGPFVYCGFKPAYILFKKATGTGDWGVFDVKRNTYNSATSVLFPNLSSAEATFSAGLGVDILSNGFKIRSGPSDIFNASGDTFIFMAFAEAPFNYSLAR